MFRREERREEFRRMERRHRRRRMVIGGAVVVGSTEAMVKMSHEEAAQIHDLRHLFDEDRTGFHTRAAGRARP